MLKIVLIVLFMGLSGETLAQPLSKEGSARREILIGAGVSNQLHYVIAGLYEVTQGDPQLLAQGAELQFFVEYRRLLGRNYLGGEMYARGGLDDLPWMFYSDTREPWLSYGAGFKIYSPDTLYLGAGVFKKLSVGRIGGTGGMNPPYRDLLPYWGYRIWGGKDFRFFRWQVEFVRSITPVADEVYEGTALDHTQGIIAHKPIYSWWICILVGVHFTLYRGT